MVMMNLVKVEDKHWYRPFRFHMWRVLGILNCQVKEGHGKVLQYYTGILDMVLQFHKLVNLYLTPFKFLGYTRTYGLNWHLINSKCRVMHNTLYLMHF
jgi:hypothetical protein